MTHAPKLEGAHGNPEVIELLETWLRRARRGKLNYACIIVCQELNLAACDYAGSIEMEPVAKAAIKQLEKQLDLRLSNKELPPRNLSLGADHVCYDRAVGPLTYDFFTWMIEMEMKRVRENAPYPLKIHFFSGKDGKLGLEGHRARLFEKLVLPAMDLIGAVQSSVPGGGTKLTYGLQEVVAMARDGQAIPKLRPTERAMQIVAERFSEPFITITLREASRWAHRNSNLPAWMQFADDLKQQGIRVIFVRDTEKADVPLDGYETYPDASIELSVRAALYEQSKANFFVSNGPVGLAYYGDKPWAMFVSLYEDDAYKQGSPQGYKNSMGLNVGEQLPWSGPQQMIVYAEDNYENICDTWKKMNISMKEPCLGE